MHAFFPDVVGFGTAEDNVAFDLRFAVECWVLYSVTVGGSGSSLTLPVLPTMG